MNKLTRLLILLVVLAICLVFLWPSLTWYARTPKETQALALGSLQNIRDYAMAKASEDVRGITAMARENPGEKLPSEYDWIKKSVANEYKMMERSMPTTLTVVDVLGAYESEAAFMNVFQERYRDDILKARRTYDNSVKLGLDLSGGMNVIVRADLEAALASQKESDSEVVISNDAFKSQAMEQAIDTLTGRIDRFGLTSPVIRQQGEDRIYIEIPGAAQADAINTLIKGKGILNFRLVDNAATDAFRAYYTAHPATAFTADGKLTDPNIIPSDCEVLGFYQEDEYGLDERIDFLVVKKEIALNGEHIKSATVTTDNLTARPEVDFVLDAEGAVTFGEFTGAHVGENLAIVSDDQIKSYARINSAITGGRVAITGFGLEEAQNIQKVLQTAWLNVPLTVESQQVIGATLGHQTIKKGLTALIVGLVAILIFMLVFYMGAGVNACVAQVLNLYMMFSILSAFNLTITLSSIAGMILTIGMAVDANVIIFERIKEEVRLGKSRAASITAGFKNAFWAIMDSNVTTFIAALFLSQLGTGAIQGFAVSLAIGVISSVFTALFVSRLMFDFGTDVMHSQKISIGWGVAKDAGSK